MASQIPESFFGRFKLDRSENFDEFLSSKGVGWFTRQMIKLASVTKVFAKGSIEGTYTMENLSSKKNVKYENFKLGEKFQAEGLDSKMHEVSVEGFSVQCPNLQITFDVKDNEVTEHHVRLDSPEFPPETYFYSVSPDNSELIMVGVCRQSDE